MLLIDDGDGLSQVGSCGRCHGSPPPVAEASVEVAHLEVDAGLGCLPQRWAFPEPTVRPVVAESHRLTMAAAVCEGKAAFRRGKVSSN